MSITRADYINNVNTINASRYGSEMRAAIANNFDYLKDNASQFTIWKGTQEEYDEIEFHDPNTLYLIVEGGES